MPAATTVVIGAGPVPQPVSGLALQATWPQLVGLEQVPLLVVEGVLNTEPAPCAPCAAEQLSLADCALSPPAGCENIAELVSRAARVATAGGSPAAVRAVLTYGEPWSSEPMVESPGWPAADADVHVELWLDPSWGPWRQAAERGLELAELAATDAAVGPIAIHIRLFETWSHREDGSPPAGALATHAAVAAADLLGQGLPYVAALAAQPDPSQEASLVQAARAAGLDQQAWQQARGAPATRRLAQDAAASAAIDLRSAPSWRVDGYRMRGHRSTASVRDVIENQQLDHLDTLPVGLVLPWDPGTGPSTGPSTDPTPPPEAP